MSLKEDKNINFSRLETKGGSIFEEENYNGISQKFHYSRNPDKGVAR
jgi:hypothetical protein